MAATASTGNGAGAVQIGILGDVHMAWDGRDERFFRRAGYDLLLCVGDLASYARRGHGIARSLGRVGIPVLIVPGNHDAVSLPLLLAEALGSEPWSHRLSWSMGRRVRKLERAAAPACLVGYSVHGYERAGLRFAVVAGRPHSMGGERLSFRRYLTERFGVGSLAESAARLVALVDRSRAEALIFVAHNGPTGLGARPADPWGCDFQPRLGDFGDADLRLAVDHARAAGKRVVAVVAGHMHHGVRGGGQRCWHACRDGVHYVNAAAVPRIVGRGARRRHHHVRLCFDAHSASVVPVWVS